LEKLMAKDDDAQKKINQYLNEIRSHLPHLSPDEVEDILDSVRTHIDKEIGKYTLKTPTPELVDAVIGEMDLPETYAESPDLLRGDEAIRPRIPRILIIGTLLLPFGVVMIWMWISISSSITSSGAAGVPSPTIWQWIARVTILPLGVLAPFLCTAFGFWGLSKIKASRGRLVGFPLAIFVAMFYPILILDFALYLGAIGYFGDTLSLQLNPPLFILLLLFVNGLVYWLTYRFLS
jgi:hypothetical protein